MDAPAPTPRTAFARARARVLRHGWNSTAYQILNPRIALWFDDSNDAVVGYVDAPRRRVAAGEPVAPRERIAEVAARFEADAARGGRRVCWFAASDDFGDAHRSSGRHARVHIGDQPVWDPAAWAPKVAAHRSLRAQLHRARNKGVEVERYASERAMADPRLAACLAEWLESRPFPTLHFLVEPATLGRLLDRQVYVASARGAVVGFLVASPIASRGGWLLEQIVRAPRAPNGTAELLVDHAMRALAEQGAEIVTMGLAPLARHVETPRPSPWLSLALRWVRAHGERFYHFRGLDFFKTKFQPDRWEPIFAVSNEPSFSLPSLYATGWAFSGGTPFGSMARAVVRAGRQELAWLRSGRVRAASHRPPSAPLTAG